jgi:ABC-type multidrug transport system ATPase subunit
MIALAAGSITLARRVRRATNDIDAPTEQNNRRPWRFFACRADEVHGMDTTEVSRAASISIFTGELVVLLGPSGSGKQPC